MIWFSCKKCGKIHGRPENSAGTLIFCPCGQGNTVPWESTAAEPVEVLPTVPRLDPVVFDPVPVPPGQVIPPQQLVPLPGNFPEVSPTPAPVANACFNHETAPSDAVCQDCGEKFCKNCLVYVQGQPLCGPCKNHRVRALHRPVPSSHLAWWSVLVAYLSGPLVFILLPFGAGYALTAILPQFLALGLGIFAVRDIQRDEKLAGLGLAVTGILSSLTAVLIALFISLYASRLWV